MSWTVVNWDTFFGIAIALCILAMSAGLVRRESAKRPMDPRRDRSE
jgi:hypothetical protein